MSSYYYLWRIWQANNMIFRNKTLLPCARNDYRKVIWKLYFLYSCREELEESNALEK